MYLSIFLSNLSDFTNIAIVYISYSINISDCVAVFMLSILFSVVHRIYLNLHNLVVEWLCITAPRYSWECWFSACPNILSADSVILNLQSPITHWWSTIFLCPKLWNTCWVLAQLEWNIIHYFSDGSTPPAVNVNNSKGQIKENKSAGRFKYFFLCRWYT